jgi:hypothetical protein
LNTQLRLQSIFVAVILCAPVRAADDLDDVMHALAARRHGEVSFVEQHFMSLLKKPLQSSGELVYDAPDRLEKRTLEPHRESLVLSGGVLTLERDHRSRVLELTSVPDVVPYIESIRATLAGDRAALERLFRLQFSGNLARWTLVLAPLDERLQKLVAEVRIEGAQDQLLQVQIRQSDGDRSLMSLHPPEGR